jgi:hypothetical protein
MRHAVVIAALALLGCEAKAQHGISPDRLSAKWESCAATSDCADPLRCIDGVCRAPKRTDVGDYLVASGKAALERGEVDYAVAQLTEAERQYTNEKLDVPADVYCALGGALVELRRDQTKAEEAARRLHRCLAELPDGSELRSWALGKLAVLGEVGFDPVHLNGNEVSDRYLTKAPRKPPVDELSIAATGNPTSKRKSFASWIEALGSSEVKAALVPCYEAWWKATRKKALSVTVPFKYRFRMHPDEESLDRGLLTIDDIKPPADPNLAAATQCAATALAPIADKTGKGFRDGGWTSAITLAIKP